jgi:hypothetical protein
MDNLLKLHLYFLGRPRHALCLSGDPGCHTNLRSQTATTEIVLNLEVSIKRIFLSVLGFIFLGLISSNSSYGMPILAGSSTNGTSWIAGDGEGRSARAESSIAGRQHQVLLTNTSLLPTLPKSSDLTMPEVIYQTRENLYPNFGLALRGKDQVYVRKDLPECVKRFVISHEVYHLGDKAQWWIWMEVKATIHAAMRHPMGFVACASMSLAPYRLRYYWQRIRGRGR